MGGFSTLGLSWEQIKQKLESEGAKNKQYDSDVDGVFDTGAIPDLDASKITSGVLDLARIPTIPRSKLEYPTEDVSFAYLAIINKVVYNTWYGSNVLTKDSFTDKAVFIATHGDYGSAFARVSSTDNQTFYNARLMLPQSTEDFRLSCFSEGNETILGTESVDLNDIGHGIAISVSGSTIKGLRYKIYPSVVDPLSLPTAAATLSATDTTLSSGLFGYRTTYSGGNDSETNGNAAYLLAPLTPLPKAKAIVEMDIISENKQINANLKQNLVEISKLDNVPDFLKQEYKKYELLKQKGFTDEEIQLLLGYIPQHQVDLASVTWGAFDYKPEHTTVLITITGGNAYTGEKAIQEQIEHAKSKNLKVLKPPRDYSEAIEQYRQLKQEFTEWIAGTENFAFQVLGHEDIEPLAVADFYYGELIEHKTHYKQLKRVPEWEMERTLNMWNERIKRVTAVPAERKEKHQKKMSEILKKGW